MGGRGGESIYQERQVALERVLGPASPGIISGGMPFQLGGPACVLTFREFLGGSVYVTSDCWDPTDPRQPPNRLGNYELVICLEDQPRKPTAGGLVGGPHAWAISALGYLGQQTLSDVIQPGDTLGFAPGSTPPAMLAVPFEYAPTFKLRGRACALILLIGITSDELAFRQAKGPEALVGLLKERGVFPYTYKQRASVCPPV